jgi:organic hydroperoxide reductase OsmC/OhrA
MGDVVPANLEWNGSTASASYGRDAVLSKPGGAAAIPVSALARFGGDGGRWNPEDLLAGTLAHCHMLTFLALAAKARLDVRGYRDRPESEVMTEEKISRVGIIRLQPTITVAPGTDPAKVEEMFHKAHKYCVIANSVKAEVVMAPRVVVA